MKNNKKHFNLLHDFLLSTCSLVFLLRDECVWYFTTHRLQGLKAQTMVQISSSHQLWWLVWDNNILISSEWVSIMTGRGINWSHLTVNVTIMCNISHPDNWLYDLIIFHDDSGHSWIMKAYLNPLKLLKICILLLSLSVNHTLWVNISLI